MSSVLRLRGSLSNRLVLRPNVCHSALFNSTGLSRKYTQKYTQIARKQEEVKYDQRRIRTDYGPAKFDHTEHLDLSSECMWRLVDKIPELKLIEVAELGSIMMKKVALKIPPIVGVMKPGAGLGGMGAMKGKEIVEKAMPEKTAFDMGAMKGKATAEAMSEKTAFDKGTTTAAEAKPKMTAFELKLESFDASAKIKLIKEIRSCTGLGLKEAKDLVESIPSVFKKDVSREEGEKILEKMKTLGAKVVMEKTVQFELKLESFDAPGKYKLVKEVQLCTGLGLKEAVDLVKNVPSVFKKDVSKEEAEKILEKMKALGAKVIMERTN